MASNQDVAFPVLGAKDLQALEARGRVRPMRAGEILFAEGDRNFCFFVVREGSIEIVDNSRDTPRVIAVHRPGHFTGDVDMCWWPTSTLSWQGVWRQTWQRVTPHV